MLPLNSQWKLARPALAKLELRAAIGSRHSVSLSILLIIDSAFLPKWRRFLYR
ncbi:Uncharacterised protein [Vibrio cholerae]|nr:Uncharacterised protein [Vibrio cholerae]